MKQDVCQQFSWLIWMHITVSWMSLHKWDLSDVISCIIQLLFKMSCFWINCLFDKSFIKVSARFSCVDISAHLVGYRYSNLARANNGATCLKSCLFFFFFFANVVRHLVGSVCVRLCIMLCVCPWVRLSVCFEPCHSVGVIGCVNQKECRRRSRRSGQCQGQKDTLLSFSMTTQRGFSASFIIPPSPALTKAAASLRTSLSPVVKAGH